MSHDNVLSDQENLYRIRHSLAHLLGQAVVELFPNSKLGFGPPIDDGFYYDFILSSPLSEGDFPAIEKRMKQLIAMKNAFDQESLPIGQALACIDKMGEPYKRQYAEELIAKNNLSALSFFKSGEFIDMCEGPHVKNTQEIPIDCFRLRSIAGAYWRGDSRNVMMTRIYAWAFENKDALEKHIQAHELALERDHKKIGKDFGIFVIDDEIGKGLPLWLPNGTIIRDELEKLMKEIEFKAEYQRVSTPPLARSSLYKRTGHLPYFAESMYPPMELKEKRLDESGEESIVVDSYHLRPMNCPHHHKVFSAFRRSYRELPLRLAEYGQVFRFEDSGALSGLLRVRGMCQNDAHIYCSEDQVDRELRNVLTMYKEVYGLLGIENYRFRLSLWDANDPNGSQKYVEDPVMWGRSEALLRNVLDDEKLPYFEAKGEAAFYGPKIDIQLKSVTGREETASTIQLDFASASRLDLVYIGSDNKEHRPFIIHRAPLGTHERTAAFLLELYGGAFPTWLAPVQVQVIAVNDSFDDYARKVVARLRSEFIRAEGDYSSERLQKKIRNASMLRIPNIVVVGEREQNSAEIALRRRGHKEQEVMKLEQFVAMLASDIRERRQSP